MMRRYKPTVKCDRSRKIPYYAEITLHRSRPVICSPTWRISSKRNDPYMKAFSTLWRLGMIIVISLQLDIMEARTCNRAVQTSIWLTYYFGTLESFATLLYCQQIRYVDRPLEMEFGNVFSHTAMSDKPHNKRGARSTGKNAVVVLRWLWILKGLC